MLSAYRKCARRFLYEFIWNKVGTDTNVHLHAGAAFAKGLEVTRREYFASKRPLDEAIALGALALIKMYGDFTPRDENSNKALPMMLGALGFYFERWPIDEGIVPEEISGTPAIEFNFAVPFERVKHPDTNQPIIICGRFDFIGKIANIRLGEDDKTAGQLGTQWLNKWRVGNQITTYCLVPETEVLTEQGWKQLDMLKEGEKIAQWEFGDINYTTPTAIYSPHYKGTLYDINGKVSLIATPDHRQVFWNLNTKGFVTKQLIDTTRTASHLQTLSAGFKRDGADVSTALIQLVVAAQADGSYAERSGIRFHGTKSRKFARLIAILDELEAIYNVHETCDGSYSVQLSINCPINKKVSGILGPDKCFGPWLLSWSGRSLRTLLEELQYWDGTSYGLGFMYFSSNKNNTDWVQTIAALANLHSSCHQQEYQNGKGTMYRVWLSEGIRHTIKQHSWEEIEWDAKVYCVSVASGYFIIRHRGKITVTGNCWGARASGIPLQGFNMRGIGLYKRGYEGIDAITYRKPWQLEEWEQNTEATLQDAIRDYQRGFWEANWSDACSSYSGCPYLPLCESENPEVWLPINYIDRKWDPLASRD